MRSFAIGCALALSSTVAAGAARGDSSVPVTLDALSPRKAMVTQAQLDVLDKLIAATPDESPEKPDLLLRRAMMYLELADHYAALATPEAAQKSSQWRLAGIKALLDLVDSPRFTSYARLDEAIFTLADQLTRVGKEEHARKYFKRLIVERPKSRFIPNAFLSFGEYYFAQNDCETALKFYDKVLQYPESTVGDFARYKSAWCYFNLSDYKQSLAVFVQIASTGRDDKLKREARQDAVRAYAKIGQREKARPFFARFTPPDELDGLMQRLDETMTPQDSTR